MEEGPWKFDPNVPLSGLADEDAPCPRCGYNLRDHGGPRCPECGRAFDPGRIGQSQIPWVRRRELGRRRAFWRTVVLNRRLLCYEVTRRQDPADGRRFCRAVMAHLGACVLLVGIITYLLAAPRGEYAMGMYKGMMTAMGLGLVAVWACAATPSALSAACGLSGERERRTTALGCYAFGTLTFCVVPICLTALNLVLQSRGYVTAMIALHVLIGLMILGIAAVWSFNLAGIAVAASGRGWAATLGILCCLVPTGIGTCTLLVGLPPWLIAYVMRTM